MARCTPHLQEDMQFLPAFVLGLVKYTGMISALCTIPTEGSQEDRGWIYRKTRLDVVL